MKEDPTDLSLSDLDLSLIIRVAPDQQRERSEDIRRFSHARPRENSLVYATEAVISEYCSSTILTRSYSATMLRDHDRHARQKRLIHTV